MRQRRRIWQLGLWLALAGLLGLAGCSGRSDSLRAIQERGILLIGLDPSYVPFEALAPDGGLYGLDVDLGRELAQRLGVEPSFVLVGYDGLYDALALKNVDLLISALLIEPERSQDVSYSMPYVDAGLVLVTQAGAAQAPQRMAELTGRTLAVEYASAADVEARRWARRLGDLDVLPLDTPDEALAEVQTGQADAALVDAVAARLYRREHPGLELAPEMVISEPYAVALRAGERKLLQAVNAALAEMIQDGSLQAILDRWL